MAITREAILRRVEKVRQAMRQRRLEALVIYSAPTGLGQTSRTSGNVRYLSNVADPYWPLLLVLPLVEEPALLMGSPPPAQRVRESGICWVSDVRVESDVTLYGTLARGILQDRAIPRGRIGLVGRLEMTVPIYYGLTNKDSLWEFEDSDELVGQLRVIKDSEEIERHRIAAKISDKMLNALFSSAQIPGIWANQLMVEMEYIGRRMGAEDARAWIATGPEAEFYAASVIDFDPSGHLHSKSRTRQIEYGDRIYGGTMIVYDGYWAHGIRMGIKGKPDRELKHLADAILHVQNIGIEALKPGARVRDAVKAMEAAIDDISPYPRGKDPRRGKAGHGLGLSYADPLVSDAFAHPSGGVYGADLTALADQSTLRVQPGMVIELHPNFGVGDSSWILIGDVVLTTETGAELLTTCPRELYEI